jgi:DNA-binding IclR family transcriptional regulator
MEARLAGLDGPARGEPAVVEALRAQVAQEGCALVDGNLIPGLRVLAAPVFDLQGRLALVVNSIASEAIPRAGDAQAKLALMATCRGLTETLGGVWPLA